MLAFFLKVPQTATNEIEIEKCKTEENIVIYDILFMMRSNGDSIQSRCDRMLMPSTDDTIEGRCHRQMI